MYISNNKRNYVTLISFIIGLFPLAILFTPGFLRFMIGMISFLYPGILIGFIILGKKRIGIIEYLSILLAFSIVSFTSIAVFLNLTPLGINILNIVICLTAINLVFNIYLLKTRFFYKELKFDLIFDKRILFTLFIVILSISILTRLFDPLLFHDSLPYWDSYYWLYLSNFEAEIGHTPQVIAGMLNLYRHGYDLFFASLSLITGMDLVSLYSFFCPIFGGFLVLPLFHIGKRILKSNLPSLFFSLLVSASIPFSWLFLRTAIPRAELFGLYLISILAMVTINPAFSFRFRIILNLVIIWGIYIFHLYSFPIASLIFLTWLGIILSDKYNLNKRLSTAIITFTTVFVVALSLFFFSNTINMIFGIEVDLTYGSSISEFGLASFVIDSGTIALIPIFGLIGIFYLKRDRSSLYSNDELISQFMRLIITFWIFLACSIYLLPNILGLNVVPWPIMRLESYYQLTTIIASMLGVNLFLQSLIKGRTSKNLILRLTKLIKQIPNLNLKIRKLRKYIPNLNLKSNKSREFIPIMLILSLSLMALPSLVIGYVDYTAISENDFAMIIPISSNHNISNGNLTFAIVGENLMNDGRQYDYFLYYSFNTNSSDLNFYFPQILNLSDLFDYISVTKKGYFSGTRYVLISSRCSQVLRIHAIVLLSVEGYEPLSSTNFSVYIKV